MKSSALLTPVLMAALAGVAQSALSIPLESDVVRAAAVAAKSLTIDNSPRLHPVGDRTYPYIHGPKPTKPSLHYANFIKQAIVINTTENTNASRIQNILAENGPYSSLESFLRGYKLVEEAGLIDRPQAVDNSDECFGAMRLSIRGHNLQLVREGEYSNYLESLPQLLSLELCNTQSIDDARQLNHIFVQDFSGYRNFTDESAREEKYAPNVLGFFCFNDETDKLMPLAITLLDTGLTYTKLDSAGEWQLAKMALDATELNYQQMRHLVETHLMSIPIQVEMIRSMDERHPIYALLDYHFFGDLALEALGGKILFSRGSPYDRSMAFGAGGSMRYIVAEFERHTLEDDLPTIIEKRGLNSLPNHRYVRYGTAYYSAVKAFVTAYTKTCYESDEAVRRDVELQSWATRSAEVPEIHGFPSKIGSIDTLVKLVTHLVFQNAVKHHFMNGIVSWHSQAAPFSTPAIFGSTPLPTVKGVEVNPLDYAIPSDVFPLLSYMAARFHRPIPRKFSLLEAYVGAPFDGEPQLAQHIEHFHQLMELLEVYVDNMESKEAFPFPFVKPSLLPWFSYI